MVTNSALNIGKTYFEHEISDGCRVQTSFQTTEGFETKYNSVLEIASHITRDAIP